VQALLVRLSYKRTGMRRGSTKVYNPEEISSLAICILSEQKIKTKCFIFLFVIFGAKLVDKCWSLKITQNRSWEAIQ
jgi:hypothetical protein